MHGILIRTNEIPKSLPLVKADFSNVYYSTFLHIVLFFCFIEEVFIECLSLMILFVQCCGNRSDMPLKTEAVMNSKLLAVVCAVCKGPQLHTETALGEHQ